VIRVTVDSNIFISALEFQGIGLRLIAMARSGSIRIDTSDAILAETIGVLRDKFHWDAYRLHFARLELLKITHRVQPTQTIAIADDPDDDRVLECAVTAGSDYILSYDKDLLRLNEFAGIKIVTASDFLLFWPHL
jgi:putative PIN family toxin of toxin-antitoxin system